MDSLFRRGPMVGPRRVLRGITLFHLRPCLRQGRDGIFPPRPFLVPDRILCGRGGRVLVYGTTSPRRRAESKLTF